MLTKMWVEGSSARTLFRNVSHHQSFTLPPYMGLWIQQGIAFWVTTERCVLDGFGCRQHCCLLHANMLAGYQHLQDTSCPGLQSTAGQVNCSGSAHFSLWMVEAIKGDQPFVDTQNGINPSQILFTALLWMEGDTAGAMWGCNVSSLLSIPQGTSPSEPPRWCRSSWDAAS